MNLDQIASRIAHPDSCLGSEIPALKTLTEKYPFAQVFSILYLKALSGQNDIGFDEALQKHAYRVTDRMKLYDLIHSVSQPETDVTDVVDHVPGQIQNEQSENESLPVELVSENTEPIENIENTSTKNDIDSSPIEFISENTASIEDESVNDTTLPEIDPADTPSNDSSKENDTPENETTVPGFTPDFIQDEVELEIISQVVATVYNENLEQSISEKPVDEKKSEPSKAPVPEAEEGLLEGKRSFSSWLKAGNQNIPSSANQPVQQAEKESKHSGKQTDKIIDQFIEKEPTISRPKKEFYSPTKKAKESVSSAGLIYTETLADIFAIQGNFPKAITAYEQLMLTNPEKKIFFAQRIKELKEKLNT